MRGSVKNKIHEVKLCKCGCGMKVKWNKLFRRLNDFIDGHKK